tara:strand:- start:264 stop:680 length:417 start_codon:yes stop_codon:yes gene_type:complete
MKLTKQRLKQIINEELAAEMAEQTVTTEEIMTEEAQELQALAQKANLPFNLSSNGPASEEFAALTKPLYDLARTAGPEAAKALLNALVFGYEAKALNALGNPEEKETSSTANIHQEGLSPKDDLGRIIEEEMAAIFDK